MWGIFKNGTTGLVLRGKLRDSATGQGKTGLTSASAGLIIATIANNEATSTAYSGSNIENGISPKGSYLAPTSGKVRFVEVDATNHPGLYEIHLANARLAVASALYLNLTITATGILGEDAVIQLPTAFDPQATNLGLTGTVTVGTNNDKTGYTVSTNSDKTGYTVSTLGAGVITASSIASDAITAAKIADGAIDAATFASGAINAAAIASDAITAAKIADAAIDTATFAAGCTIPRVTLTDTLTTYTGNTPQTANVATAISAIGDVAVADGAILKLLTADRWIDKTTDSNHWALVLIEAGTGPLGSGNELLRQPLYDVNGSPLHSTSTVIGRSVSP